MVVFAVILAEADIGSFRLMFPFVDVIVYEPVNDSDPRFAVSAPLVVVAVTAAQEVQAKFILPFVPVRVKLVDVMPVALTFPFVSVNTAVEALILET